LNDSSSTSENSLLVTGVTMTPKFAAHCLYSEIVNSKAVLDLAPLNTENFNHDVTSSDMIISVFWRA
jgi:hypothetical protein